VDLLGTVNNVTSRITDEEAAWKLLKKMHDEELITQGELIKGYLELSSGIEDLEDVTEEYTDEINNLKEKYEMAYPEEQRFVTAFNELAEATIKNTTHASSYGEQLHKVYEATSEAREGTIELTTANGELETATDKAAEAQRRHNSAAQLLKEEGIDYLAGGINSLVQEAMSDFQGSITETMALEAAWLWATGQITEEQYNQRVEIANTLTPLAEMIKLVDADKLSLDYLHQSMTDGIVTEQELTASLIATGMSAKDAAAYVATLSNNINGLTDKTVTVTTRVITEEYLIKKYGEPGYQHGANFIVPPGYPNDSYRMNVESGEHVVVTPANQVNNNYNMNLQTNAQSSTLMRDFRMMKALAG
jgi:hypothetical protein